MDHFIGIPTRKELSGQLNQPIKMNSAELFVRTIRIFWHSTMHSVDGRWGNYDQEMKPSIESCSKVKECHRVLPRTIYLRTKLLNKDGIQAWVLIWPWWILTNINWLFLGMVYTIDYAIPTAFKAHRRRSWMGYVGEYSYWWHGRRWKSADEACFESWWITFCCQSVRTECIFTEWYNDFNIDDII